eukprot:1570406-Alexandrium_andersonii.AAC.1
MSSRNWHGPSWAPVPSDNSDHAGPPRLSSARVPKSSTSMMRASSISTRAVASVFSAASAASFT